MDAEARLFNMGWLENRMHELLDMLNVELCERKALVRMLDPLRNRNEVTRFHYLHSLRVGLVCHQIAYFLKYDIKPLFYAGLLHDIGKVEVPIEILGKAGGWTDEDREAIKCHVIRGYHLLRGQFDFIADVVVWHHQFQQDSYPDEIPPKNENHTPDATHLIPRYGRLLALADCYDALFRRRMNPGERTLTWGEMEEEMLKRNPAKTDLIKRLYEEGIFNDGSLSE